MSTNITY